ncbi:MAG TPA: hypothetical protein VFQ61_28535 [Polyangiaceae bacterium]|nr:hypothetical protein [Polyangiaceae bacterium]
MKQRVEKRTRLRTQLSALLMVAGSASIAPRALAHEPTAPKHCKPSDPVAEFETFLPLENERPVARAERPLLIRYLENPRDLQVTLQLAAHHAARFAGPARNSRMERSRHGIYALYFLRRAESLGVRERWTRPAIRAIDEQLTRWFRSDAALDFSEGTPAQLAFLDAFNEQERNRHRAAEQLLGEFLEHPTNLTTAIYLAAVSLWNGGESGYADPGMLYSFLDAGYFGQFATELSERAEREWELDPDHRKLFRLGVTTGGMTLPARRWLAGLHGDREGVDLVDAETMQWFAKAPSFYMFPASVYAFGEPDKAASGFDALLRGLDACNTHYTVFCGDNPRATFSGISFFMYLFDYFSRMGQPETAMGMLGAKANPDYKFDAWYLGQEAWAHREENATRITELYQNSDPKDDPLNTFMKRHKWGPLTSTCQTCHQTQGVKWSAAEKAQIPSLPTADLYVGDWPIPTIAWDGTRVNQ